MIINENNLTDEMSEITKLIQQFDKISNGLEHILNGVVKAHQRQLVIDFKQQTNTIKEKIQLLQYELEEKDKKIEYYETKGTIAELMKRVDILEKAQNKLLEDLKKRNAQIKELKLQTMVYKSQNKRLQDKIKQLIRNRIKMSSIQHQNTSQNQILAPVFTTEIAPQKWSRSLEKHLTQTKPLKIKFKKQKYSHSIATINSQLNLTPMSHKYEQEIAKLREQNKQLIQQQKRNNIDLQITTKFFMDTLSELKESICIKKKLKKCSLQDFKKQDKLELLITLLCNENLLTSLYESIFKQQKLTQPPKQTKSKQSISICRKISTNRSKSIKKTFPTINSTRLFSEKLDLI